MDPLKFLFMSVYSFYLGNQPYLLVADMKLLKELMVNATEHFRTSNEVSAHKWECSTWVYDYMVQGR